MEGTASKGTLGAKLLPPRVRAIHRERLETRLARLWEHRLGVVVGPAGSGKTTLVTQFALGCGAPVAWYRADGHDASGGTLVRHLARAFGAALGGIPVGWHCVEDAVEALAQWDGARALLVVDDLHLLEGTAAEATLARLVDDAPHTVTFLVAGRRPPRFNLPRLRVSGLLLEIGPDDLRFRSWEVEHLFRDFYHESLSPEDLAALARRTEGWAAGLQLFHLATAGKPPRERRRVLHELAASSRVVHEYLTRNVLDDLPDETSRFLLATSVLGCLTGSLCDQLLDATGSDRILAELEQGQVFTTALDDGATYRYHEVLRSHLEAILVQRLGEEGVRTRYRQAGALLEAAGAAAEALRAYTRAGDEEAVAKLLGARGEEVVDGCGDWVDGLPSALVDHDPWLRLAAARRSLAAGRWREALEGFRAAEGLFGSAAAIDACRQERLALGAWLEPVPMPSLDCSGVVRLATTRDPLESRQAVRLGGAAGRLATGLATLLAGYASDAAALCDQALEADDARPLIELGARLASQVARTFAGAPATAWDFEELALEGERLGAPWLARLARGLIALTGEPGAGAEAAMFRKYCESNDDPWGSALGAWLQGLADLEAAATAIPALQDAEAAFRRLGAAALGAWAMASRAVAQAAAGDPQGCATALRAQSYARAAGVRGAQAFALRAMALTGGRDAVELEQEALALAEECGIRLDALLPAVTPEPVATADGAGSVAPSVSAVVLRSLGTFRITIGDTVVDCSVVKPRARICLRLLVMHVGRAVHKETLVECLWPGIEVRSGLRNLHVVISALRQLLEPGVARGASSLITRDGDSYRLVLPPGSSSDVLSFQAAMGDARQARGRDDREAETAALRQALDAYGGDLLPDAGPAEWVVDERERYRMEAADAAQALADAELARGDVAACAAACERGLRIDRHRDRLWRLRIEASDRAGDRAGSASARLAYEGVLAELGVPAE